MRYPHNASALVDPASITIILLSEVQTLLNPYLYLVPFNFAIYKKAKVKLSVNHCMLCSFEFDFLNENVS